MGAVAPLQKPTAFREVPKSLPTAVIRQCDLGNLLKKHLFEVSGFRELEFIAIMVAGRQAWHWNS